MDRKNGFYSWGKNILTEKGEKEARVRASNRRIRSNILSRKIVMRYNDPLGCHTEAKQRELMTRAVPEGTFEDHSQEVSGA
jgi:hypothetical protein